MVVVVTADQYSACAKVRSWYLVPKDLGDMTKAGGGRGA